eukprot:SAG31_NODE_7022_length_1814_cov_1.567172_2_plen_265_part_00
MRSVSASGADQLKPTSSAELAVSARKAAEKMAAAERKRERLRNWVLSKHQFMASFFELADLWSAGKCSLSNFAHALIQNIGEVDSRTRWDFKPLRDIRTIDAIAVAADADNAQSFLTPGNPDDDRVLESETVTRFTRPFDISLCADHMLEHRTRCTGQFFSSVMSAAVLGPVLAAHLDQHMTQLRALRLSTMPDQRRQHRKQQTAPAHASQSGPLTSNRAAKRRWNALRKGGLLMAVLSEMDEDYSGCATFLMMSLLRARATSY